MPEDGTFMLRQLFLSHSTIASYLPEARRHDEGREMSYQLQGWWYLLKLPKLVLSAFFLRVLIGISYDLWIFGIPRAFDDGIRPGNAVRLQLGVKLTHYSSCNLFFGQFSSLNA